MTYNSKTQDVTLALLRGAIQGEDERLPFDVGHIDAVTWKEVMELSITQGVAALCYDSLEKMQRECLPPKEILLTWFGLTMQVERSNKDYVQKVNSITNALHDNGTRVVVLKGLACSRWYHRPEHRSYGDFDCFLCGEFNKGNEVMQAIGGSMEPCYYKHSEVFFKGLMVENHRYLLNIRGSRNNKDLERHLQRLIIERPVGEREYVEGTTIEIPCADVNALFLMVHMFTHFLDEGTNLRQLSDWAVFLKHNQNKVDWLSFYHWTDRLHLSRFAEAVTFVAASHLGVSITNSNIRQDGTYAKRILDDALWESEKVHSKQLTHFQLLLTLSSNFFRSQWKYNEIYQRSALLELLNAGWSWIFERNPKL